MPRTKLDKHRLSRTEMEAKIIKCAAARNSLFTNVELAEKVGCDSSYLSKGFKKGFTDNMKLKLHKALRFTQNEFEFLFGVKNFGEEAETECSGL